MGEVHVSSSGGGRKYTKTQLQLMQIERRKRYEKAAKIIAHNEKKDQDEKNGLDALFDQELDAV